MESKILTPDIAIMIVYLCIGIMLVGMIATFHNRAKRNKGIGGRAIQMLTVVMVVPSILALAVLDILKSDTVAALLGALIGYVLSGLSDFEKEKTKRNSTKKEID